jgi:hypothetical protein
MNKYILPILLSGLEQVASRWCFSAGSGERESQTNWRTMMMLKTTVPILAACFALTGGAAFAGDGSTASSGTYGAGGAAASPTGAAAGGEVAADARARMEERRADRKKNRKDRHGDAAAANSASTYGSGAVSTTRGSANAGVTSGGAASGSGTQSTGTTVDAYGETTKDGSSADIYGDSTATSGAKP